MEEKPDLHFWLIDYQVKLIETPKMLKVLKRKENDEFSVSSKVWRGYSETSGGVQLMAIALRLNAGDVTALKEAVLKTRPEADTLSWYFVVGEWVIPTSTEMLKLEDIVSLFTQAVFLYDQERYDAAITLYGKIIGLKPDWDWPYNNRGLAYEDKEQYDQAISDCNKALEINPRFAIAYSNQGLAYAQGKGQYDQAISDYNKALEINPRFAEAHSNRGFAYAQGKGQYDEAISDYNKALEINPRCTMAYMNRGAAYYDLGKLQLMCRDFRVACELGDCRNFKFVKEKGYCR